MDSKLFWNTVETKRVELIAQHKQRLERFNQTNDPGELQGQPAHGKSLYIASVDIPGVQRAGAVVEAVFRLSAQKIVERSHELASAAQIEAYLEHQRANLEVIRALDARLQNKQTVVVEATLPRGKK